MSFHDVGLQICALRKALVADCAMVRPEAGVSVRVSLQLGGGDESLPAFFAAVAISVRTGSTAAATGRRHGSAGVNGQRGGTR